MEVCVGYHYKECGKGWILILTAAILRDPRNKFAKNERDRLQKDIQHWLAPPDPSTNHHIAWKAHHPGTSSWFFESDTLTKWKKTGSFLMIHGKRIFLFSLSARNSILMTN